MFTHYALNHTRWSALPAVELMFGGPSIRLMRHSRVNGNPYSYLKESYIYKCLQDIRVCGHDGGAAFKVKISVSKILLRTPVNARLAQLWKSSIGLQRRGSK